jgi:hypothetical protein
MDISVVIVLFQNAGEGREAMTRTAPGATGNRSAVLLGDGPEVLRPVEDYDRGGWKSAAARRRSRSVNSTNTTVATSAEGARAATGRAGSDATPAHA